MIQIRSGDFEKLGYVIVHGEAFARQMEVIRDAFIDDFQCKFTDNVARNRRIIKLLAEHISVKQFFCHPALNHLLKEQVGIGEIVQTGPVVTHYTSADLTGNNYGLPYHQDWPSMGTSTRGVIVWTSLRDIDSEAPGLRLIPGSQKNGLWPGTQTESGYVLDQQDIDGFKDVEVAAGDLVLMSPYLVHKTKTVDLPTEWKLSLSCRYDDFSCDQWNGRDFVGAYGVSVDRSAYLR
ncbi:phytanoyl-CoA dioxygenase family protein [Herbaspirillum huttiense]|uniref:phytanoyl-CoA dioxygenase family protein n=1 Tax=Herbaspirillum huttiense TaxID=863372 RepID=UPI0039AFAAF5